MLKKERSKILIIGPVPPPSGGVSLHILRMVALIKDDFVIELVDESRVKKGNYFNIRSLNLIKYLSMVWKADLIYIHSGVSILRVFHIIIGKLSFKKVIITIHSYSNIKNKFVKYLDEYVISFANSIIIVNENVLQRLTLPRSKCTVKHAFIPPEIENEPDLPHEVINWIEESKIKGRLIICANASQLRIFNNHDLYGLDMCIELTHKLKNRGLPCSFIFIVSSLERGQLLFKKYSSLIKELSLEDDFLLLNQNLSFFRLIERSDIVLRPTNTDGDALTVREALDLGKPVIASDIVSRPLGAILFKTRDLNDLETKINDLIDKNLLGNLAVLDNSRREYRAFYTNLINRTLQIRMK